MSKKKQPRTARNLELTYRCTQEPYLVHVPPPKARTLVCGHRRCGKSVGKTVRICVQINKLLQMREVPIIGHDVQFDYPKLGYIANTKEQARNIIWPYFLKYFSAFPHVHFDNHRMRVQIERPLIGDYIEVPLKAARHHNDVRGERFFELYCDEYQDYSRESKVSLFNTLIDLKGNSFISGTAKGMDNIFYDEIEDVRENGEGKDRVWIYPASHTGIIPEEDLDDMRRMLGHSMYMRDFECDFTVSYGESYYSNFITELQNKKKITHYNPDLPCVLAVDIGVGKSFSAWLAQVVDERTLLLLDYYEGYELLKDLADDIIETWGVERYGTRLNPVQMLVLPHDSKNRQMSYDKVTRNVDVFAQAFPDAVIKQLRRTTTRAQDIVRVKENFHLLRLFGGDTDLHQGISKVNQYGPRTNEQGVITGAEDKSDGTQHAADALRYLFVGLGVKDGIITMPPYHSDVYREQRRPVLTSWATHGLMKKDAPLLRGGFHGPS